MDVMDLRTKEIFLKNLFSILSADRGSRIFGKESVISAIRELNISKNTIQQWFNEWKQNPGAMIFFEESSTSSQKNREMFFYTCAALLADETISNEIMKCLFSFAKKCGLNSSIVNSIFSNKNLYTSESSFIKRGKTLILSHESQNVAQKMLPPLKKSRIRQIEHKHFYVAHQISPEGLDELQRLLIAYHLGCHAAIEGPTGVGKTHCVTEIAKILGLNLYTKTCSNRTTESHIISFPVLSVQDGATITTHVNGPLVNAMIEPGIFYGDEFNLLKEDVQKRLNSAFDERRYIDRNDGVQIMAKTGFWAVISYNPTENLIARDLEESVADRFVHYYFSRWPSAFKAYIAYRKAAMDLEITPPSEKEFGITLSWRGISSDGEFYIGFVENEHLKWRHFFSGKPSEKPDYIYQIIDNPNRNNKLTTPLNTKFEGEICSEREFSQLLSQFTEVLHSLTTKDYSSISKIGMSDTIQKDDLELLSLHESSARIEIAALKHYHYLLQKGFDRCLAQSYATRLVIDQVCFGQHRTKRIRTYSIYDLVTAIAKNMKLLPALRFNTHLSQSN
ncbi:MAG: MoxR family ATPase [Spirochaetes bacterium]|nr:MoxR family ATPase [Spirochaetota bacterium]